MCRLKKKGESCGCLSSLNTHYLPSSASLPGAYDLPSQVPLSPPESTTTHVSARQMCSPDVVAMRSKCRRPAALVSMFIRHKQRCGVPHYESPTIQTQFVEFSHVLSKSSLLYSSSSSKIVESRTLMP